MNPSLVVFGDRTANEVLEAAILGYHDKFGCIEKVYFEEPTFSQVHLPKYTSTANGVFFNVGISNVQAKRQVIDRCIGIGWKPFTVVHPTAYVSPSCRLGNGVFVGPLGILSSNSTVGDHSIVHLHSSIGHDARIGEYCSILPGARISGNAIVGDRVLVGSNAFVNAGIRIGHDCQVDALTYVSRDLPEGYLLSTRAKRPMRRIPGQG